MEAPFLAHVNGTTIKVSLVNQFSLCLARPFNKLNNINKKIIIMFNFLFSMFHFDF